jgi:hypothetical protein
MGFAAARAGEVRAYTRAIRDAVRGAPAALATRRPLRAETYTRLRGIRGLRPGVLARIRRHVRQPLI